jgi:hypothetical protein
MRFAVQPETAEKTSREIQYASADITIADVAGACEVE